MSPATFGQRRRFCLKSNKKNDASSGGGSSGKTPNQSGPGWTPGSRSKTWGVLKVTEPAAIPKLTVGSSMVPRKAQRKMSDNRTYEPIRIGGPCFVSSVAQANIQMHRIQLANVR